MDKREETQKSGRIRKAVFGVCAIALLAAVALRVMKPEDAVETTPLPTVSVAAPEAGSIALETSLIGQLQAGDVYYVTPKTAGEILEIFVAQGDQVSEGDPICRIDNQKQIDAAKIALDSAKVSVQSAADSVQTAQTNLGRMQALFQAGDIWICPLWPRWWARQALPIPPEARMSAVRK